MFSKSFNPYDTYIANSSRFKNSQDRWGKSYLSNICNIKKEPYSYFSCTNGICGLSLVQARSHNCEAQLLASSCLSLFLSVRPSVGPHETTDSPYTILIIISRSGLLSMKKVSDDGCRENQNTF